MIIIIIVIIVIINIIVIIRNNHMCVYIYIYMCVCIYIYIYIYRASLALRIVLVAYLLCMTLAHWSCSVIGLNGVIVWLKLLRSLTALHTHHGAAICASVCLAGGVTGPGSGRVLPPVLPLHR